MPRKRRGGLAAWLSETSTPVFVLDARRVVLFFNHGCEGLTGWSAAEVVGRTCDYAAEADPQNVESLTGALCPPPDLPPDGARTVPARILRRDGTLLTRNIHFFPLPAPAGEGMHCLGVIVEGPPATPTAGDAPPQLHAELTTVRADLLRRFHLDTLIARSPAMLRAAEQVRLATTAPVAVFLTGEEGTGREYVARLIHTHSPRRLQAFIPLDCGRLTDFELQRTLRRLAAAPLDEPPDPAFRPGALCLRQISRLPRELQQLLLDQFLTSNGGAGEPPRLFACDVVVPETSVAGGHLLPDLAFRLTTLRIDLPPLRERSEDLPLLAQFFLEQVNRDVDRQCGGFSQDVLDQFRRYHWPGNVRELRRVVEECHAAARGPIIVEADLPFRFRTGVDAQKVGPPLRPRPFHLEEYLESIERREIERVLGECRHNRALAARCLGLTRARLYRRMQQLGLDTPSSPPGEHTPPPSPSADDPG